MIRRRRGAAAAGRGAAWLIVLLAAAACGEPSTVIFDSGSGDERVRVLERADGLRSLYLGAGRTRQSALYPGRPLHLEFEYTRTAMIHAALAPPDGRILFVGLGGGAMPMYVRQILPDATIDVVEIDPVVIDAALAHFGFEPDARMTVHAADGRAFIEAAAPASYDVVMLDAFSDDGIPLALATRQFLEAVRDVLVPGGVVVSNLWTAAPEYPSMVATYADVFDELHLLRVARRAQRIVIAGDGARPLDHDALLDAAFVLESRVPLGFDLPRRIRRGYEPPPVTAAPVLDDTDP